MDFGVCLPRCDCLWSRVRILLKKRALVYTRCSITLFTALSQEITVSGFLYIAYCLDPSRKLNMVWKKLRKIRCKCSYIFEF